MRVALGVHVSTYEATASLVEISLPELGPICSRTVDVAAAPGGIGGAVSAALGFMRVQALQNQLTVLGGVVVCESAAQREIVARALAEVEPDPPPVIDMFDDRLSDQFTPDVAAALLVGHLEPVVAPVHVRQDEHRGIWPVAAVGACVLAALGGVTAWAMTSQPAPAGELVTTSEMVYPTSEAPKTADSAAPVGVVSATTSADRARPDAVPDIAPVDVVLAPPVAPEPMFESYSESDVQITSTPSATPAPSTT
ncbi:hypothetical protein A2J03_02270, partial [Rhodococcus sp. EPR-157]|uniref:hypothetical protein n=1 Tax=Rhodococcus sp. EPR-157 TaxID=1813677 RepID=UPI0007BB5F59